MNRYNTIVQVLIKYEFSRNKGIEIMENKHLQPILTGMMIEELFPSIEEQSNTFITNQYRETHQITWDISGSFNMTSDQVMESSSELEAMQKHFNKVLIKHLGKYDTEYKVYACGYSEPIIECFWNS